jgi:hypothetical protein
MKNQNIPVLLIVALICLGAGFFAGQNMSSKKSPMGIDRAQFGGQLQGRGGNPQSGAGQIRGGQVIGEITSIDSDKLTIKEINGSSKIILVSGETSIVKSSPSNISDLKIGTKIAVFGKANTDALISAQSIQVDPQNRMMATPSATIRK